MWDAELYDHRVLTIWDSVCIYYFVKDPEIKIFFFFFFFLTG